jgi:hypothetical protein
MSRSDIQITCLTRYIVVARLQPSHLCCPDTTPWADCLCECPICVLVNVTTYASVTFQTERVFAMFNNGLCKFLCLYEATRSFMRVPRLCMLRHSAMAAQNRRNRTMDGQCLEYLVNEFEERFRSEPARF